MTSTPSSTHSTRRAPRLCTLLAVLLALTATGCDAEFWFWANMDTPIDNFTKNRNNFYPDGADLNWRSDNCSVPNVASFLPFPLGYLVNDYKNRFKPMCRRHDFCYRNGTRFDPNVKAFCDNTFHDDMDDYCTTATCRTMSDAFYLAVKQFGTPTNHGSGGGGGSW